VSVSTERSEGSPLAFLKFYGSDFLNATASWTMEERGIYITLLWYSWVNGGLPGEVDRIDRMAPGAKACWPVLESKFAIGPDGLRRNPRQERDRATMRAKSESAAERGRRGAEQRWSSHSNSHPSAIEQPSNLDGYGMAIQSSEFRVQSSEVREQKPENSISLNGSAVEPDSSVNDPKPNRRATIPQAALEALWLKFPRKVGKKRAMALLDKGVREIMEDIEHDEPTDALIYMGERIDALAHKHRTTDPKFIPHPATWLGQGRYLDPVETQ
jgi:uncharacterized protein YdaU (DUF1376 family)